MDLHEACRRGAVPPDGIVSLEEPVLAREAAPLRGVRIRDGRVDPDSLTDSVYLLPVDLEPGRHCEIPVPAWAASVLVAHDGFCLSGTDGECLEAHPGSWLLYRRRNRASAIVLVAGPRGCRATLVVAEAGEPVAP